MMSQLQQQNSYISILIPRSIHPEAFCKKVFLNILQNSQESTCAEDFLHKVTGLDLKTRLQHKSFHVNFENLLRTFIF